MKLKTFAIFAALATQTIAPFAPVAMAEEPAIDYAKINETVEVMLADLIAGDEVVTKIEMSVDPALTDLVNDKLALRLFTELKRTSWSEAPSRLTTQVQGAAVLSGPADAQVVEAKLGATLDFETDSVPMLRSVAVLVREFLGCGRAVRANETGKRFACDGLAQLAQVTDLNSVATLLLSVQGGFLQMLADELVRLNTQLAEAATPEDRARIEQAIAQNIAQKNFVAALSAAGSTDANNQVTAITLRTGAALELSSGSRIENAAIDLSATKFSFGLGLFLKEPTTAESYATFKQNLVDLFRKVEAGDAAAGETLKTYAAMYMSLVKGYTQ